MRLSTFWPENTSIRPSIVFRLQNSIAKANKKKVHVSRDMPQMKIQGRQASTFFFYKPFFSSQKPKTSLNKENFYFSDIFVPKFSRKFLIYFPPVSTLRRCYNVIFVIQKQIYIYYYFITIIFYYYFCSPKSRKKVRVGEFLRIGSGHGKHEPFFFQPKESNRLRQGSTLRCAFQHPFLVAILTDLKQSE